MIDEDYEWLDNSGDDKTPRQCSMCMWSGKQGDCDRKRVSSSIEAWMSLAGREGYEYYCPVCGNLLHTYYWKMS